MDFGTLMCEFDNHYQIMASRTSHYQTSQKQAILDWMMQAKHHPTVEDVYNGVKQTLPKIGFATVYRNLQKLVVEGQVKEVQFVDKKKRYETLLHDHQHFICTSCHRIIDMELSKLLNVGEISKKLQCHEVQSFNLELIGLCAACRKPA